VETLFQNLFLTLNAKLAKQKADNHVRFFESNK